MYKRITNLILLIITTIMISCGSSSSDSATQAHLLSFDASIKSNVIFYKNDLVEYHLDSFNIIGKYSDGTSKPLNIKKENILNFDASKLGIKAITIKIGEFSKTLNIEVKKLDIVYSDFNNTITISDFENIEPITIVPRTIKGKKVTKIEFPGFYNNQIVKEVKLPNTLLHIGQGIFEGSSLEKIVIPDSVTKMDMGVFPGSQLNSVVIGKGLKSIPWATFNRTKLTEITIPDNIEEIGYQAFLGTPLKRVNFGKGLLDVKGYAFNLTKIELIELPLGVKNISAYAFSDIYTLKKIVIPNSVETIEARAFSGINNNIEVNIPKKFDTIDELKRIFMVVPLKVNSNTKPAIFTQDEKDIFKTVIDREVAWINGHYIISDYQLTFSQYHNRSSINYTIIKKDNIYELTGFTKLTGDFKNIRSNNLKELLLPVMTNDKLTSIKATLESALQNNKSIIKISSSPVFNLNNNEISFSVLFKNQYNMEFNKDYALYKTPYGWSLRIQQGSTTARYYQEYDFNKLKDQLLTSLINTESGVGIGNRFRDSTVRIFKNWVISKKDEWSGSGATFLEIANGDELRLNIIVKTEGSFGIKEDITSFYITKDAENYGFNHTFNDVKLRDTVYKTSILQLLYPTFTTENIDILKALIDKIVNENINIESISTPVTLSLDKRKINFAVKYTDGKIRTIIYSLTPNSWKLDTHDASYDRLSFEELNRDLEKIIIKY